MIAAWPKWRGLYYISSEMRCTVSFVVFYTEKLLSPCLYFFYRTKCIHMQYLHKACIIKNKAKSLVKDILCQQCCMKEQCTKYKQREMYTIKFLHMTFTMTVIFSKCKPNQNKPIFNWGGGVNTVCGLLVSPNLKMCINCEGPRKIHSLNLLWKIFRREKLPIIQDKSTTVSHIFLSGVGSTGKLDVETSRLHRTSKMEFPGAGMLFMQQCLWQQPRQGKNLKTYSY